MAPCLANQTGADSPGIGIEEDRMEEAMVSRNVKILQIQIVGHRSLVSQILEVEVREVKVGEVVVVVARDLILQHRTGTRLLSIFSAKERSGRQSGFQLN
jgi:hypothetical protein